MIKTIRIEQLKLGMFIHDLMCGWISHPFIKSRFLLENEDDLIRIESLGIQELCIDTAKGADCAADGVGLQPQSEGAPAVAGRAAAPRPAPTTLKVEMVRARRIHGEAVGVVRNIMKEIRTGRQVEVEQVTPIVSNITDSIFRNNDALLSLSRIKEKDNYTFQHSVSVCALLVSFCKHMEMDLETIHQVGVGGLLHDVGKMLVPEEILNKPGPLTPEEFTEMKTHAQSGREMLQRSPGISEVAILVAGQHHERIDGSGYPDGLRGDEISPFGQMASIVDVYDAITSNRVYRKPMEPTEALRKIYEWSDSHFSEPLVSQFIKNIGIYPTGSLIRLESQSLGVVVKQNPDNLLLPTVLVVFDLKTNRRVEPRYIDMGKMSLVGNADRIIGHESPARWKLEPVDFF